VTIRKRQFIVTICKRQFIVTLRKRQFIVTIRKRQFIVTIRKRQFIVTTNTKTTTGYPATLLPMPLGSGREKIFIDNTSENTTLLNVYYYFSILQNSKLC